MLSDVTWRKMPTDMLTNETMTYIESQMPSGFEYAPFMFYQAALKKADDDGSFDLEDGILFARLMRVPDVKLVFKIAILMVKRGIITQVQKGSNLCLLTDWEYSKGTASRTMAERRAIVARKIEASQLHNSEPSFVVMPSDNAPELPVFDDKNQKNVVKSSFDDKNQKNVVKNTNSVKNDSSEIFLEREKERERERENTHTEREKESLREREREAFAVAGASMAPAPAPAEKTEALARDSEESEIEQETEISGVVPEFSTVNLAAEAINTANKGEPEKEPGDFTEFEAVCAFLESFFITNCFGYDQKRGKKLIKLIAEKIMALEGTGHKASKIVEVCCEAFKKMHDEPGQWKDIPLQPVYMAKDGVWAHILTYAGKKLTKKGSKSNTFFENAKKAQEAADAEREELIAQTEGEYIKFGIDPKDPNRVQKLLIARNAKMAADVSEDELEGAVF